MQPDQLHPAASQHRAAAAFPDQPARQKGSGDPSLSIFLGLYLLVLAFFILLVSLSTIEEMKARAVMESLTATFGNSRPSGTSTGPGEGDPALLFERTVIAAFASLVHVARVEIVRPGRLLRAELPAAQVFADEAAALRPAVAPLLDRIVAAVSSAPGGGVAVELALAATDEPGRRALAMARADAFAREMLRRGAPPHRLSIALSPQAGDQVWLTFARVGDTSTAHAKASGGAP